MLSSSQKILSKKFLEIVEQLTFMFGELVDKFELDVEGAPLTVASMDFEGDLSGKLVLVVPTETTTEITANILGLDPEDIHPGEMMNDALREMLNVVCGHVIMGLAGTDANFKLLSPVTETVSDEAWQRMLNSDDFIGFVLDESPVLLGLKLEN